VLIIILALAFASFFLLLLALAKPKQKEDVESRLKRLKREEEPPAWLDAGQKAPEDEGPKKKDALADLNRQLDELFTPLAQSAIKQREAEALAKAIANAGRYGMTPLKLRVWQYKGALAGPLASGVFFTALTGYNLTLTPLFVMAGAAAGYFYPLLKLHTEANQRRNAILRQLPTTLDLMTICVEAGLSLQAAMFKVVEKTRPSPLRDEVDQTLREIQLGRPRAEALKDMARRINIKEVNSVVLAMVQAEAMGTSVGKSLRVQSEIARENRWARAQEKAYQAPVKLTFPLVFFIFPVVFIVIFGPIVLDLMANWSGG
jgi:tight adherence protein C